MLVVPNKCVSGVPRNLPSTFPCRESTPILFLSKVGQSRWRRQEVRHWNGIASIFQIKTRHPQHDEVASINKKTQLKQTKEETISQHSFFFLPRGSTNSKENLGKKITGRHDASFLKCWWEMKPHGGCETARHHRDVRGGITA